MDRSRNEESTSIKEALVIAQSHLSLQLTEGLKRNAHHDQQRGAAESQLSDTLTVDRVPNGVNDHGKSRQSAQEERAQQGDSTQDLLDIVNRGRTGVEERYAASWSSQMTSDKIGSIVLERLRHLDAIAYIRFASVYQDFKDVAGFIAAISALNDDEQE